MLILCIRGPSCTYSVIHLIIMGVIVRQLRQMYLGSLSWKRHTFHTLLFVSHRHDLPV